MNRHWKLGLHRETTVPDVSDRADEVARVRSAISCWFDHRPPTVASAASEPASGPGNGYAVEVRHGARDDLEVEVETMGDLAASTLLGAAVDGARFTAGDVVYSIVAGPSVAWCPEPLGRFMVRMEPLSSSAGQPELGFVHAAISRWFDHRPAPARLGVTDFHHAKVKDYTVGWPIPNEGAIDVEIGTLSVSAVRTLAGAAQADGGVRLGKGAFRMVQAPALCAPMVTWGELGRPDDECSWTIDFRSPTTFMRKGVSSPFPDPAKILHGLAVKWNTWGGGADVDGITRLASDVLVTRIEGRTENVRIDKKQFAGFVGTTVLETSQEAADVIRPLLRLAEFAGIGAGATKGLGTVLVRPVGAPRFDPRPTRIHRMRRVDRAAGAVTAARR